MRAWQVTKYGRPTEALELVDIPDPNPGPGEILVRPTASVLNSSEVVGFASGIEAEEVPMVSGRALCFGNFDILGVILAYLDRAVLPDADRFMPPGPSLPRPTSGPRRAGAGRPARAARGGQDPTHRRQDDAVRTAASGVGGHGVAQYDRAARGRTLTPSIN